MYMRRQTIFSFNPRHWQRDTKEDIPILFEPGYTTKYNEQGVAATGIGLSHVQQIIQKLNGDIHIKVPEQGTIFQIRIPSYYDTKVR